MKWIDVPPVWLAGFALLAWLQARAWPMGGPPGTGVVGVALVAAALVLMALAVVRMWRRRTTPIPHREPSALVTDGVFALSRNPIYLGDVTLLAGLVTLWHAWPSLALVPLLGWVLSRRFVAAEEARLARAFGEAWHDYARRTRRWL